MRTWSTTALIALGLLIGGCGAEDAAPVPVTPSTSEVTVAPAPPTVGPVDHPSTPPPTALGPRVIPRDFPLTDGYPADDVAEPGRGHGLEAPHRASPPLEISACGEAVALPDHTDRLRAGWSNIADARRRQLATFAGERRAAAYVGDVVAAFRTCARQSGRTSRAGALHTVVTTRLGDQGAAVSTHFRSPEGCPTALLGTLHVVRVGEAVLLATTTNEGGAGPEPEADAADQVATDADAIAGVVDAMADL